MNSNWRNRPTTIDYVSRKTDWIIGIDESGNPNLNVVLRAKREGCDAVDSEKHFTVTACAVKVTDFFTLREAIMDVKFKYWDNALFTYKNKEKRVCFHSKEIRCRRGAFNPDEFDYDGFIQDLSAFMRDASFTLYASHIDKSQHVKRYSRPHHPYDLCMDFVLERLMRDLGRNETCIIVLESRGAKEDKLVLTHIKQLIDGGNFYNDASLFKKIKGVYFNPKWCKTSDEKTSYWILELADLCAYPIQKLFVYGTEDLSYLTIEPKFSNYPGHKGYGLKSFP